MFPGFASRIEKEIRNSYIANNLKNASDKTIKIKIGIIDSPRRKFSVFIGAGVLANIVMENIGLIKLNMMKLVEMLFLKAKIYKINYNF